MAEPAPFFHNVAEGPSDARAVWLTTTDGLRLRAAHWPSSGARGTVLVFNGRTEWVEKYARLAGQLAVHGLTTVSVDWRGQGLSDRLAPDRQLGHVGSILDYQRDVAALLDFARQSGLAEPYYLIGHSMGGAIGLRALLNELPIKAAVFSAPMWGISMSPAIRPAAWALGWATECVGAGARYAPSTGPENYLLVQPFESNALTTDPEMYAYMRRQLAENLDLGLGGPSLHWLYQALLETRSFARAELPTLPVLTALGGQESIVDPPAIRRLVARWPSATLLDIPEGKHELLMERAEVQAPLMKSVSEFFLGQ